MARLVGLCLAHAPERRCDHLGEAVVVAAHPGRRNLRGDVGLGGDPRRIELALEPVVDHHPPVVHLLPVATDGVVPRDGLLPDADHVDLHTAIGVGDADVRSEADPIIILLLYLPRILLAVCEDNHQIPRRLGQGEIETLEGVLLAVSAEVRSHIPVRIRTRPDRPTVGRDHAAEGVDPEIHETVLLIELELGRREVVDHAGPLDELERTILHLPATAAALRSHRHEGDLLSWHNRLK